MMNQVHGKMVLNVAVGVKSEEESMGVLEANYNFNPERIVAYKLVCIDHKGIEHSIMVNDLEEIELNEYVGLLD